MIRALVISHELCLADVGVPCATPAPWPTGPRRPVQGFTLPELLVVIAIISILATAMMAGMASVTQTAKEDRTRTQIAKIHVLLMEKWESFQTRRMPVNSGLSAVLSAELRLAMVRELIRLEFPDRITDLEAVHNSLYRMPPTSLYKSYRRKVATLWGDDWDSVERRDQRIAEGAPQNWTYEHQGAECLYLILSRLVVGDASALEMFNESEIGDLDGDGMREILDAWGTPVRLLRYPTGFAGSPLSLDPQPDPFDPMRVDSRHADNDATNNPYYILPLVVSAGPDGVFDLAFDLTSPVSYWNAGWFGRSSGTVYFHDPFNLFGVTEALGSWVDENSDSTDNSLDNIHNHLIAAR